MCKQKGHLKPQCPMKGTRQKTSHTKFIQNDDGSDEDFTASESLNSHFIEHGCYNITYSSSKAEEDDQIVSINVSIDKRKYRFEADSGSAHSFISTEFHKKNFANFEILKTDVKLKDYVGQTFAPTGKGSKFIYHNNDTFEVF